MAMTREALKEMQAWDLNRKILVTQTRLMEWHSRWDGQIYISFSGGKDSTVLLDIAARIFPEVKAMFIDTGLEYIDVRPFVFEYIEYANSHYQTKVTLDIEHPRPFPEIIKQYGYPLFKKEIAKDLYYAQRGTDWALKRFDGLNKDGSPSKIYDRYRKYKPYINAPFQISEKCCVYMKEAPARKYERKTKRKPVIGILAEESMRREMGYLKTGCNSFDVTRPRSTPIAFWTEQDILAYIDRYKTPYCKVYGEIVKENGIYSTTGVKGTGCVLCLFGARMSGITNFVELKKDPREVRRCEYCLGGGEYDAAGKWRPNKEGLGMQTVCDYLGYKY